MGLLARERKDIDLKEYGGERYHYARLIAHTWFDILEDLKSDKGVSIIGKL